MKRIVVGVDGSDGAAHALGWAVEEGHRHGAEVEAVLIYSFLDQHHADSGVPFDARYDEHDALAALRSYVTSAVGDAPVRTRVVCDLAASGLLDAAVGADLLVVGARGLGGFKGLLLGSVSERVLEEAPIPVAVVREASTDPYSHSIVVGVDERSSRVAVEWAADEARVRGARLHVVHAWRPPFAPGLEGTPHELARQAGERVLAETLASKVLDELDVQTHLVGGSPAGAILEVAGRCSLVVVGTRGRSRFTGTLLGSTSRQVVHHAPCPVVVAPPEP